MRILIVFTILLLAGCASAPDVPLTSAIQVQPIVENPLLIMEPEEKIKVALLEHFKEWASVKYKFGGLSKDGVDCSGFVYLAFLNQFGVKLPRNTTLQVKLGTTVAQDELKAGDLVFFKTGPAMRHVGIYLDHRRFIHASSSEGVTTSSLDSKYWANAYWTAKRLDHQLDAKALPHRS
jgi:hypothetical protein